MAANRDPDRTKRNILDAAAGEFCEVGLAGARIDSIAAAAGVNKRMLYHYFGSKEGLFAAVLAERLETALDESAAAATLAERLTALQQQAVEHPESLRLLMWEALADRGNDIVAAASRNAVWRGRIAAIEASQRDGLVSTGVDAAQLQLAFAALALFPFAFPQLTRLITGTSTSDPEFLAARSRFLATIAALFEPPAGEPMGPKPRFRLVASVTEVQPRRQIDSNTRK